MENKDEFHDPLRAAERAAAAPYVDYPKDPWWVAPGFGVFAALFVLSVHIRGLDAIPGWAGAFLLALSIACCFGYMWWQRRRRGTTPSGKAPHEVTRVLRGFAFGAVVVGATLFVLADMSPLVVGLAVAFIVASLGMIWFGRAYDQAAIKVRKRLA